MHVVLLRLPPVVPGSRVNVTVPVGVLEGVVVSFTVAVHVEDSVCLITLGEQISEMEVLSGLTEICTDGGCVPGLPLWVESPP